jgi:hypothetical protein
LRGASVSVYEFTDVRRNGSSRDICVSHQVLVAKCLAIVTWHRRDKVFEHSNNLYFAFRTDLSALHNNCTQLRPDILHFCGGRRWLALMQEGRRALFS